MKRIVCLAAFLFITAPAAAQELAPELQFGARGVVSGNLNIDSGEASTAVSDFSDTAVLVGARQKLFNDWRGQMVVGFQFPDADSDLGQVFFHRVFVHLQNQQTDFQIGRTRLTSALAEFPTLRDDDVLVFTDVLNPFSDGEDSQDSQFGNVIEVTRYVTPRLRLGLHGEHYAEAGESFALNAAGIEFQYEVPETQRWNQNVISRIGISLDGFFAEREGNFSVWEETLKNVKGALVLNVVPDPVHFVQLSHQTIYVAGFDDIDRITGWETMTRARSLATFTTLGYTYRRYEWPTLRAALGAGYKTFSDVDETTNQFALLGNVFYRLGANFDVGFQAQHRWTSGDLLALYDDQSTSFKVAFVYAVDQLFNNQFDDRDSILNLEHGYIE